MSNPAIATGHLARSEDHYRAAERLAAVDDEWAVVAYFYACHRAARAAFYSDERLNSDAAARGVHQRLTAGSRHVDFHNGHPSRGPGVNDIVKYLYPTIGAKYELLHRKSSEVRYESGLTAGTVAQTKQVADEILAHLRGIGTEP